MSSQKPVILFFDNGTNYLLFMELARVLKKADICRMVFVTMIESRVAHFRDGGIEAIYLDVSKVLSKNDLALARGIVSSLEARNPSFRLNLAVKRDRILRLLPKRRANRILSSAVLGLSQILDAYRPALIVGEVSWAIEYLFCHLSADKGVAYRHILNIPGDSLRIAAFDDRHSLASVIESSPNSRENESITTKSYSELCGEVKAYKVSLSYFLRHFHLDYSRNDYRQALFYRLRRAVLPIYRIIDRLLYKLTACEAPDPATANILFTLHIQPESTPDFVSPFYADQVQIAKTLIDALRSDQVLYIKDHPNTVSIRNILEWWRLLRHPQVRLLSRTVSGKGIYSQFSCVVSVAGTAILECSEAGVPVVCFSDVYFGELPGVIDARDYPDLASALTAAVSSGSEDAERAAIVRKFKTAVGFPGFIHDARVSPKVLNPENVASIARLIEHMLWVQLHK